MPKPLPTSTRTVALTLAPLGVLLALAVWSLILPQSSLNAPTTAPTADSGVPSTLHAQIDPVLLVPPTARVVLSADIQAIRRSPSVGPSLTQWLSSAAPGAPCALGILAQTHKLIAFASDRSARDVTAVLTTDATVEQIAQCVAQRAPRLAVQPTLYRGQHMLVIAEVREAPLLPSADAQAVVRVGRGLVLIGSAAAAKLTIDRALSAPNESALNPALSALERTLPDGYSIALLALLAQDDGARARYPVEAASLAIQLDRELRVSCFVACADFDSPRVVVDALQSARAELLSELRFAALTRMLQNVQIDRAAASVNLHATVGQSDVQTLLLLAREWITRDASALRPDGSSDASVQ